MHTNPPYMMPPGGPPQAPYPPYPQMSGGMQPYSPCTPQPPMAAYPHCPPTSGQAQMHPAYQQAPQLPGAYPRSPSRMNPQKAANLQQWMDPHLNAYSPAPSAAPSIMSNMSMYSDHNGSTMSFGSVQFEMPMEEMRSPSQISAMSCSENIDPQMQQMMPPMPPQPNSPQAMLQVLPTLVSKWKEAFLSPHHNHLILCHIHQLLQEFLRLQKAKDPAADQFKVRMTPLIHLIPKMIELFGYFNENGIPPYKSQAYHQFKLFCWCFWEIMLIFSDRSGEDTVAREIQGEKNTRDGNKGILILIEALRKSQNMHLLFAVGKILEWKQSTAKIAGFRGSVRGQIHFMQFIVSQVQEPKTPIELLYQLGIISTLADGTQTTKEQLVACDGKDALGIIPVMFLKVHPRLWNPGMATNEKALLSCMKIFRQMVTIVHYLLVDRKKDERKLPGREYCRRVTVAIQLISTGGLFYICDYFKTAMQNSRLLLREDDVLLTRSGDILKHCCDLLPRQRDEHIEYSKLVDQFREMVSREDVCNSLARTLKECVDLLIHSQMNPCPIHEAFAQSFYQITNFSEIVQSSFYMPAGIQHVQLWLSTLISVKYSMPTETWAKVSKSTLETEDTFLFLLSSMLTKLKTSIPEQVFNAECVGPYLRPFLIQLADLCRARVLANFTSQWNLHKSIIIRLLVIIPKMVRRLEVLRTSALLLTTVDNVVRQNSIAWFFNIMAHVYELYTTCRENKTYSAGLADIAVECFRCVKLIWIYFDPSIENDPSLAAEVRSGIKNLVRNHSNLITEWLQTVDRSRKKQFLEMLSCCETVCVDEVAIHWSKQNQDLFRDLAYNEDSDINNLANKILSKFEHPAPVSLYETLGTAMDFDPSCL